ncbi:MAG: hypothetical protein RSB52_08840 [Acidaminococcaceae bacterium]
MAIPVYNGGTNALGASSDNRINAKLDVGGEMHSAKQDAQTSSALAGASGKMFEEIIKADVWEANTAYNKQMNAKAMELLQKEQAGAKGVVEEYTAYEQQVRESVGKTLPRIGNKAQNMFASMADKDASLQLNRLRTHQAVEMQKYKDTTLLNTLSNSADMAAQSYNDGLIRINEFSKARFAILDHYGKAGREVVEAKQKEFTTNFYGVMLDTAILKNDYSTANGILSEAMAKGASFTSLAGRRKSLLDRQMVNNKIVLGRELSKKFTSWEEAETYLRNSGGQLVEGQFTNGHKVEGSALVAGMAAQEGAPYKITEGTSCMKIISNACVQAGVEWEPTSYVPDAVTQAQEKKIWKDTVYVPQAGDVAIIGDDDHAVMYDGSGTWQAGESKNAVYHDERNPQAIFGEEIKGWIAMSELSSRGNEKVVVPFDDKDLKDIRSYFDNERTAVETEKNRRINYIVDASSEHFKQLYDAGDMDFGHYKQVAEEIAGTDTALFTKLLKNSEWWYKQAGGGSGSGSGGRGWSVAKMPVGTTDEVRKLLRMGIWNDESKSFERFDNKEEFLEAVKGLNPNGEALNKFAGMYDDYMNGKCEFKYDMQGVKEAVFGDSKVATSTKNELWRGAEEYIAEQIREFETTNHREPTYYEVVNFGKDAIVKTNYGKVGGWFNSKKIELSPAQLQNAGIAYIEQDEAEMAIVHWSEPDANGYRISKMRLEELSNIFNK